MVDNQTEHGMKGNTWCRLMLIDVGLIAIKIRLAFLKIEGITFLPVSCYGFLICR